VSLKVLPVVVCFRGNDNVRAGTVDLVELKKTLVGMFQM